MVSCGCAILPAVSNLLRGLAAAAPLPTIAIAPPTVPSPELASPWIDRSALETITVAAMYGDDFDVSLLPLTRDQAMAIPAVSRARSILCSTLGRLPLYVYREGVGDEDDTLAPRELPAAQLIRQPDPAQSRFLQLVWTVDDLIFHGVSWWQVTDRYAEDRRPRAMRRILPGGVELHGNGKVTVYRREVNPADVVRIDGPHEGILAYGSRSLRTAGGLEASAARFADNPVAAIELHQTDDTPMKPTDRIQLVKDWVAARRGANGGVAMTTRNIEVKVHGAPDGHLLTAGRNASAIDCARHIGVPADAIDASPEKASQNYANRTDRLGVLVDYGLAAYGAAITARLSMVDITPTGYVAAFDYDAITATADSDPDTSAPRAAIAPAPQEPTE